MTIDKFWASINIHGETLIFVEIYHLIHMKMGSGFFLIKEILLSVYRKKKKENKKQGS